MVAHSHLHVMHAQLAVGHYPQRHRLGVSHLSSSIIHILCHVVAIHIKECPHACLTETATAEVGSGIRLAETEVSILAAEPSLLARKLHNIL